MDSEEDEDFMNFKTLKRTKTRTSENVNNLFSSAKRSSTKDSKHRLVRSKNARKSREEHKNENKHRELKSLQNDGVDVKLGNENNGRPDHGTSAHYSQVKHGQEIEIKDTNSSENKNADTIDLTEEEFLTVESTEVERSATFSCVQSLKNVKISNHNLNKTEGAMSKTSGNSDRLGSRTLKKPREQLSSDSRISHSVCPADESLCLEHLNSQQEDTFQAQNAVTSSNQSLEAATSEMCDLLTVNEKVSTLTKGSNSKDTALEGNRCPFCQMPFKALAGLSPNWHTMECMDIPLNTMMECPAGLKCDSTIPSHYRRYRHSKMALHLAGHHKDTGGFEEVPESQNAPDGTFCQPIFNGSSIRHEVKKSSSQQSQGSQNSNRRKRKSIHLTSRKECSGSEPNLSQSQGSQTNPSGLNGSMKSYFSPSKKRTVSSNTLFKNSTNIQQEKFDPMLKLLVMSDSESDADAVMSDSESDADPERGNEDVKEVENGKKADAEDMPNEQAQFSETGELSEDDEADEQKIDSVSENGDGFVQDSVNQDLDAELLETEAVVRKKRTVDSSSADVTLTSGSSMENSQKPTVSCPGVSVAAFSMRKQTSLFSFFNPQYRSSNPQKQQSPQKIKVVATTSKPSLKRQSGGRSSMTVTTTSRLVKSASEPVNFLPRIPSPPPPPVSRVKESVPVNNLKPHTWRGRPSTAGPSTSGQASSGRQCPFYKKLPGTAITVDAFHYGEIPGCQAYVLTHFHYDHYQGLTKRFSQPMYCTSVTANLVEKQIGVASRWVNRLPMDTPTQVAGVWLTLMEANHCPGAVIILFELPNGKKMLHTGDFRANPCMEQYPPLVNVSVDDLYLDTTYCDPSHAFPSQKEAIQFAVTTALKTVQQAPGTLVVCGAYTIGKERIFIALAEALQSKVCVQSAKKKVLDCLEDDRLKNMISLKRTDGCVHVLPMKQLNARGLEEHLAQCPQFTSVLAFEPTGWTHSKKSISLDTLRPKFTGRGITIYGVPYSEHSSFLEMKRFVQFLRPKRILPTVNNGNPTSRRKMEAIFKQWLSEGIGRNTQHSSRDSSFAQQSLGTWLKK